MKRETLPAMLPPLADTHTFIIRICQERDGSLSSQPPWRGVIEQVGSDRHVYFFNYEEIAHFIQEQTGIPLKQDRRWWQTVLAWIHHV